MGFKIGNLVKGAATGFVTTGSPWGALGGAAMSAMQQADARSEQKQAQKWWNQQFNTAADFTREQMQNRIQWSVQDALKAGINPAVAAGAPSNVTGTPMPQSELYSGQNAQANTEQANAANIQAQTAQHAMRSQTMLNESQSYKNYTEAGLMDRNTAAKEIEAHAAEMQAYARRDEANAVINQINAMLPGNLKGQALELVEKTMNNQLTENDMKSIEKTGLSKTQWIDIAKTVFGGIVGGLGIKRAGQALNSARNYSVEFYNGNGKFTGAKKIINN